MNIKKIVASLFAAGVMVSPLAYATNGDTMMAVGSQSSALGGTGVANFVGAESTFANPAMLAKSKGREATGGINLFKPNVANDGMGGVSTKSTADTNYIPDFSYSSRISDTLTYGFALAGIAGMGVDYTGANPGTHVKAKTTLSILKVVPTIAYNKDNYGVGFSPILQYGSLAISYDATGLGSINNNPGHNKDTDTNFGYALGGYYNATPTMTIAAAYSSEIQMKYGKQLSNAGLGFGQVFADNLTQPAEVKAGVAYKVSDSFTVTADYRLIQWASAKGYKEFGWKDQNVLAIGGKYSADGYWIGLGYNNANNPIKELQDGTLTPSGNNAGVVNMFNNLLFPAIVKDSFTFGGGYSIDKNFDVEGAVVISPEVKARVDISDAAAAPPGSLFNTTTHSQRSYSVSLRYKF